MARPKKKSPAADRHKPSFMVRIPMRLRAPLEIVAADNAADVSEIVRRAVLDLLKREGRWPPPSKDGTKPCADSS